VDKAQPDLSLVVHSYQGIRLRDAIYRYRVPTLIDLVKCCIRDVSFGVLAITILNTVLRPLLAKWHPLFLEYDGRDING